MPDAPSSSLVAAEASVHAAADTADRPMEERSISSSRHDDHKASDATSNGSSRIGPTSYSSTITEKERLIAFTDAVVAIAMTLRILPLMEASSDFAEYATIQDLFYENRFKVAAFFVSFWLTWMLWPCHEQLFLEISHFTHVLRRLNLLWMLGIVLLPVLTSTLTHNSEEDAAVKVAVYIGDILFIRFIGLLMVLVVYYDKRTWMDKASGSGLCPASILSVSLDVFLLTVALLMTLFIPPPNNVYSLLIVVAAVPIMMIIERVWPTLGRSRKEYYS